MNILSVLGSNKFWNVEGAGAGMAHHNAKCSGRSSRSYGIMRNSGFGAMSLIIDGKKYVLPAKALKKDGCVRKSWKDAVRNCDVDELISMGAVMA